MVGKERERSLWNRVWPSGGKGAYEIKHTRPKTLAGWPWEVTSPSKLSQFHGNNRDHPHKNTFCCHMWSGHCPFVYSVSSFLDRKMEMKINPNSKMVGGFPGGSVVKKPPASAGDSGSIPRWEDSLEKQMETHSNILAWEIPWTEKPKRLQSMGSQRVRHDLATKQLGRW